jgi:sugar phosphate isomerase/epimerase
MIQLGFVSAILPELSLADVLTVCAREQFQCVELMCWPPGRADRRYAGVTHIDVTTLGEGDNAAQIKEQLTASRIAVSALGYYPNLLSPDPNESQTTIEHLKRVIAAAHQLNIRLVNTFIGRDWNRSLDDNWIRFREVWPPLIKFAEDHNVRIAIENCPMLFTGDEWPGGKNLAVSPAIWHRMFDEIPSAFFGLNYDPSHLIWQHMDPIRPLHEFAEKIFHAHAKDARINRQKLNQAGILAHPLEYHDPRLPGLGDVDWSAFIAALTQTGSDVSLAIEVEDRAYEGSLDSRIQALRQSRRFLSQFLPL